jgi:adenylosuccinate lyase
VDGLDVRPENMRRNLELTTGRLASERLLLALVDKGHARETAYAWVQRCALADGDFRALVKADPDITAHLSKAEIEDALDARHALQRVDTVINRGLEELP